MHAFHPYRHDRDELKHTCMTAVYGFPADLAPEEHATYMCKYWDTAMRTVQGTPGAIAPNAEGKCQLGLF